MTKRSDQPKPVTAEWLMRAAAHYVERYATSTENLRKVLKRKVYRRAQAAGDEPERHAALVEETLARFIELGLVDDRAYAEARLASFRRRGASRAVATAKLIEKGVPRDLVEATLAADETSETEAAEAYARRRRFGPHRGPGREHRRDKEIAAMVRAGFPLRLAVAAVDDDS